MLGPRKSLGGGSKDTSRSMGDGGDNSGEAPGVNVQVAVRCRPLNAREKERGYLHVIHCDASTNRIRVQHRKMDKHYPYDRVFGPYVSQEEVFGSTVAPIVDEMLLGFNTTVFAYGPTGTGKTYTMEGDIKSEEHMGVIPRAVHAIFERLENMSADYTVRVSFLELYNEELADLLATRDEAGRQGKVVLREDARRGVVCCGLEEVQVLGASDIFHILARGIEARRTAETAMNKSSSRSHSIFTLKVMIKELLADGQEVMRNGQLNLVDLAGSENIGRSGATNVRAREAGSINQSLLTLGRVITSLVEHHPHTPYRDSKLTRLLQESLGGRARTCIIATVTASSDAIEETLSTLDYALKAKSIKNRPEPTQHITKKHLLKEYGMEIDTLRSMLQACREKNGVYVEPARFDQMQATAAAQKAQIEEMEVALAGRAEEQRAHKLEREELQQSLEDARQRAEETEAALDDTKAELQRTQETLRGTEETLGKRSRELADTRAVLEATRAELRSTQEVLLATRAVVAAQAATEELLLRQAAQAKKSLEQAEADSSRLREKIARQVAELAQKSSAARNFGIDATALTASISTAVDMFRTSNTARVAALRDSVAAAAAEATAAEEATAAVAAAAMRRAVAVTAVLADGADEASAAVKEALTAATAAVEAATKQQNAAAEEGRQKLQAVLCLVTEGLDEQQRAAEHAAEKLASAAEAATAEVQSFAVGHVQRLAITSAEVVAKLEAERAEMQRRGAAAEAAAKRREEAASAEAERLLQTVSAMVEQMRGSAAVAAAEESAATKAAAAAASCASNAVAAAVAAASQEAQAAVSEFGASAAASLTAIAAASKEEFGSLGAAAAALAGGAATATANAADEAANSAIRASEGGARAVISAVKQAVPALTALGSAAASGRAAAEAAEGEAAAESAARLAEQGRLSEAAGADTAAQLDGLENAAGDFASSHSIGLAACEAATESYVKTAVVVAPPEGNTPRRCNYPRAESFVRTAPHADIMAAALAKKGMSGQAEQSTTTVAAAGFKAVAPSAPAEGEQEMAALGRKGEAVDAVRAVEEAEEAPKADKGDLSSGQQHEEAASNLPVPDVAADPAVEERENIAKTSSTAAAPGKRRRDGRGAEVESGIPGPKSRGGRRLRSGSRDAGCGGGVQGGVVTSLPLHESTNLEAAS